VLIIVVRGQPTPKIHEDGVAHFEEFGVIVRGEYRPTAW
jgi:hypothetical protein